MVHQHLITSHYMQSQVAVQDCYETEKLAFTALVKRGV